MNSNQFKVGDLVSFKIVKVEPINIKDMFRTPSPNDLMKPIEYKSKVVARRVLKSEGNYVTVNLDGKRTNINCNSVRLVY